MNIGGFQIEGDSAGLKFLSLNKQAIRGLVNIVQKEGTASFMYLAKRYVVFPSPSGTYIVAQSEGRSGRSSSRRTDNLTTKKYL
jgi:hypothetical protein